MKSDGNFSFTVEAAGRETGRVMFRTAPSTLRS